MVDAPAGALYDSVISMAQGKRTKSDAAIFLRKHSNPSNGLAAPSPRRSIGKTGETGEKSELAAYFPI